MAETEVEARIKNNPQSETLAQLRQYKEETKSRASGKKDALPEGAAPIDPPIEELPAEGGPVLVVAGEDEKPATPEEEIRIGDQVFTSQKAAFIYAEKLEREKLEQEAHSAGVREALEAQARSSGALAPPGQSTPQAEDNFDAEFYANPKETLRKIQEQATQRAVAAVQAEQTKEKLWREFLDEYPDIRRKDAERTLQDNWNTIGVLTDMDKGKKLLAQKVRAEYAEIEEIRKPKTPLSGRKPTQSPSGGGASGVTPAKKEEKILSFSEQLRSMKK